MNKPRLKNKKAQAILETTSSLVIMVILLAGILQLWLWANNQLVQRQRAYSLSRVQAGTATTDTYTLVWPVYTPEPLTEERVLK